MPKYGWNDIYTKNVCFLGGDVGMETNVCATAT